jgi:phage-related minor tail protein
MGGWVTVAIVAIWGLVTIWDKVANAAENAAQAQRDAVQAAKGAQSRSEVNDQLAPYLKQQQQLRDDIQRAEAIGAKADASTAQGKQQIANVERYVNSKRAQLVGVTSTVQQLENTGKDKTASLTNQVQQSIADQRTAEQVANAYKEGAKYKTPAEKRAAEREEAKTRYENAKSAIQKTDALDPAVRRINQEILANPKRLADTAKQAGVSEETMRARLSGSSTSGAMAKIDAVYAAELKAINAKDKKGGAGKKPELSAGFEAGLSYTKEELELLTKLSSAQEKLLGYTVPETLARKQSLEMVVEQENTQTKIAKIQEQLAKKNLGPGVRESLRETLKAYKDRGNAISQELAVTQSLAREQNSLKQYQQETIVPAKQALELEKARAEYAVATGEMSSEEAQKQARLNDLRLIELEYAGQVAEAQKTFNELQSAGYEEAAKNSKKRLDALVKERDQKLEIAKIKISKEEDTKSLEAGWKRAWQKYKDEAEDASKLTEKLMTNVLKSVEDALFNMMSGVKVSFSDLFKSIMNDVWRCLRCCKRE